MPSYVIKNKTTGLFWDYDTPMWGAKICPYSVFARKTAALEDIRAGILHGSVVEVIWTSAGWAEIAESHGLSDTGLTVGD